MGSWIRHGTVLLALLGGVGLAALDQRGTDANTASRSIRPAFADDEATGSIGRLAIASAPPLTDEQRGFVFLGVMNLPDVPEADVETPDPAVPLSDSVELQDLPAMVTEKVPLLEDYKFVKLDDRILVVNPQSRAVVTQIPRYRLVLQ
jgi:Protein of unknown function (DUF1236)